MTSKQFGRLGSSRARIAGLVVALLASTLVVVGFNAAPAAADLDPLVYPGWGVSGVDEFTTQNYRAEVWDVQQIGDVMYVGGKFLEVQAAYSGPSYPQSYLAAFDVHTGAWIEQFTPTLNGPVYTLDVSSTGQLLAGGEFTSVNGAAGTSGLVALDPASGAVDPSFTAHVTRPWSSNLPVVRDIYLDGGWIYAVGNFSHVEGPDGVRHQFGKAVRVSQTTGQPDASWTPTLDGRSGWGVTVSEDGQRVHFAGYFTSVNATAGTALLATVDTVTGELTPGWAHGPRDFWIFHDVAVYGDRLYAGGAEHAFYIIDSTTGDLIERVPIPHDTQVVERIGDNIYVGCHCRTNGQWLYEVDGATGTINTDFDMAASAGEGAWSVGGASDGCLWIGGDFKSAAVQGSDPADYSWVGGFVRMCDVNGPTPGTSGAPPPSTDVTAPTTPTDVTGNYSVGPQVELSWSASTDDTEVRRYFIWRDGEIIGTSDLASYTDRLIEGNGTYSYAVSAMDAAWNTSPASAPIDVVISSVLDGVATQTSTQNGQTADRANDKNLDGVGSQGSVSLTGTSGWPSWELDTGAVQNITSVRLWGGTDFSYRTQNVYVFVSDTPFATSNTSELAADPSVFSSFFAGTLDRGVRADVNVAGRYIRVATQSSGRRVQLAEVQVETDPTGTAPPADPDLIAPDQVTGLSATFDPGSAEVSLAWDPGTDNRGVSHYLIGRDGADLGSTGLPQFVDTPNGQGAVTYDVRAVDAAGNVGPSASAQVIISGPQDSLIDFGGMWSYLDDGSEPAGWTSPSFDDASWASGPAPLGFGNGTEATVTADGNVVTRFRATFDLADVSLVEQLLIEAQRDDGIVVYVNGTEIWRDNVVGDRFAATSVWGSGETDIISTFVAAPLVVGTNTVAVSLHQGGSRNGGDLGFDLRIAAVLGEPDTTAPPTPSNVAGALGPDNDVVLTWDPVTDDRSSVTYIVHRDGGEIARTPDTTLTDAATQSNTTHTYTVTAVDLAGNASAASAEVAVSTNAASSILVPAGSVWTFLDAGAEPAAGWTSPGFDDSSWSTGAAELGFGDGGEATVIGNGGMVASFRHEFTVADASSIGELSLDLVRDDGAVVFINGVEVVRDNVPDGPLTSSTRALVSVWGSDERDPATHVLPSSALTDGTNVLAVSVHNAGPWSADLSFEASLSAVEGTQPQPPGAPAAPTVDAVSSSGVDLSWGPVAGAVSYRVLRDGVQVADVAATVFADTGLTPETSYDYSLVAVDGAGLTSTPSATTTATTSAGGQVGVLLADDATWRYLDDGSDPGPTWLDASFDDAAWSTGVGEFGFGDGDESTVVESGHLTAYFRTTFDVADPAALSTVTLSLIRDDGAAVYINGTEVARTNLPDGPLTAGTFANAATWGADERTPVDFDVPTNLLIAGTNSVAVEVHNESASGGDLSKHAWITAGP